MRIFMAAIVIWACAPLSPASAGLRSALSAALDSFGAPSAHINRASHEVRFVRLQEPTKLTLESIDGTLTLPTEAYPAGIQVDASELPFRLHWISQTPFDETFHAGHAIDAQFFDLTGISDLTFFYSPSAHNSHSTRSRGGLAFVIPEPASLLMAGGVAAFALHARRFRPRS